MCTYSQMPKEKRKVTPFGYDDQENIPEFNRNQHVHLEEVSAVARN